MSELSRILLLELSPTESEVVAAELRRAGLTFVAERADAGAQLRSVPGEFRADIVLAGIPSLPASGAEVLKRAGELAPGAPVVVVTAAEHEAGAFECVRAGAVDYVLTETIARLAPSIEKALQGSRVEAERKCAERALRATAEQFRNLFDIATDIIFSLSSANGSFTSLNPAFEKLTGWPREEWVGRSFLELLHPEDGAEAERRFREVLGGGAPRRLELRMRTRAGDYRHAEVIANRQTEDGRVVGLFGIARDITVHKQAEAALRESESRFKAFMNNSRTVAFIKDEAGRYVYGNQPWADQFGRPLEELLGRTDRDLWPAAVADQFRASDAAALAAGRNIDVSESGETSDGQLRHWMVFKFPVEEISGRRLVGGVALDITARKQAEEALRQSEAHFRSLIENAMDIITVLTPEGVVMYESPSVERVLGYKPAELTGRNVLDLIHPDDAGLVTRALAEAARTEEPVGLLEFRQRHKDGSWRFCEGVGRALPAEAGLIGVVINSRDLTERKRLEDQLRQAQKMEAVGRLAGGVAHDFNNLLLAILGYADLVTARFEEGSGGRDEVEQIRKASERAAGLTRQLLAFSRKQVLQPTVLDLNAVLLDLNKMLRRLIGEDIQLVTVLARDLGKVRADQGQLEQVIVNLAVNARDAMRGGGKLTIETANFEVREEPVPGGFGVPPGSYVALTVADTGCGMSEEVRSHLFEPFFTTKERGRGTGLGLSTVFGIIKQSGGDIAVTSEVGQGTQFRVVLPVVEERAAKPADTSLAGDSPGGTETILLVEDEDAVRKLLCQVLQGRGYTVLDACGSDEGLELSKFHPGPIHLLLSDLVMPGMSGRELAEQLAPARPEMRVLFASGYTDDIVFQQGLLETGAAFLQKPFEPRVLLHRIRALLDAPPRGASVSSKDVVAKPVGDN